MTGLVGPRLAEKKMAGVTGLEPATSGVTGRHSNQLSYTPAGGAIALSGKTDCARRVGEIGQPEDPVKRSEGPDDKFVAIGLIVSRRMHQIPLSA